jgi:hypothetical protein
MSKILTPKGWRDLIIEKKHDFDVDIDMEPRVRNPFLKRGVPNSEFISQPDAKKEGFPPNIQFMHYHMGKNQEDHFDTDAEKVFPAYMNIKRKKLYAVISKFRDSIFIMHHIFASSPLDAYNRYDHVTMQIGTDVSRARLEKKIPSGVKVVPHPKGVAAVYRVAKRFAK